MKQSNRHHGRRCSGFFVLDAVLAITLLLMMSLLIAMTMSKTAQAERVLADRRAAQRLAEQVLLHKQMGLVGPEDERVEIDKLPMAEDGRQWVAVRVSLGQARYELVGLLDAQRGGQP